MTGSSITNIPSPLIGFAKNGAWLSLLLTFVIGLILLGCVLYLYQKFPHLNMIEYSQQLVGKWITFILMVPFIFCLFHTISGIVLDIGLFMTTSIMRRTPMYIFILLIFLVLVMTVRIDIEKFTRMFVLMNFTVILSIIVIFILASQNYKLEHLFPIMPDGFKPILLGSYFSYGFPFSELLIFAMILPFVHRNEGQDLTKGMIVALITNVFFLIMAVLSTIMVFGPIADDRVYSMFEVARTIELLKVFTRIEILIGYSLIIGSYMKATIAFYTLYIAITQLFKLKDRQILILPLALSCFLFSMIQISLGQARWVYVVTVIEPLWKTVAFVLPVCILAVVAVFKRNTGAQY
jgi:spore germination protein KB